MSFRSKLTYLFLVLSAIPLVFLGVLSVSHFRAELIEQGSLRLEAIATLQEDKLEYILSLHAADLEFFQTDNGQQAVRELLNDSVSLGATGEVILASAEAQGSVRVMSPATSATPYLAVDQPMAQALAHTEGTFFNLFDYRSERVLAVTRYVDVLGWGLVVKMDMDEVLQPAVELRNALITLILTILVFLTIVAAAIAKSFSDPLKKLTIAALEVAEGKFTTRVTITSKDETGQLAAHFNQMAAELQALYSHLQEKVAEKTNKFSEKVSELEDAKQAMLNVVEDLESAKVVIENEKKKLEEIVDNLPVGVLLIEVSDGRPLMMNQMGQQLLGHGIDPRVNKKTFARVYSLIKEDGTPYPAEELPMSITLSHNRPAFTSDVCIRKSEKVKICLRVSSAPVKDADGKIVAVVAVLEDITKEKEIDRAKSDFVSLASHQLRTPPSIVRYYTEMLLEGDAGKISKQQKNYLQEIEHANLRVVEIVNALLNVSRMEMGTFSIEPQEVDMREVVESVLHEHALLMKNKKIKLVKQFDTQIPHIQTDPKLMRIVFQNLVSNAVKYTPEGGSVEVSLKLENLLIVASVKDSGYGIPQTQQSKIFSKLFRADNVREKDTEGTGLGLYIAKSIVDHAGGKIWFTSEENIGSVFYVSLPLKGMKEKAGRTHLMESGNILNSHK